MVTALLMLMAAGCASLANTPAQDLARNRWNVCRARVSGIEMRSVRTDGRIAFWYEANVDRIAMLDCLRLAANDGSGLLPPPASEPRECSGGGLSM